MLKDKFDDIDIAGRGQIQKQDFWDYIDVVPSPFTDKVGMHNHIVEPRLPHF